MKPGQLGYKESLEDARQRVRELEAGCPHEIGEWGRCGVCGKDFGWRCKESPDGVCHYDAEYWDGKWMWKDIFKVRQEVPEEVLLKMIDFDRLTEEDEERGWYFDEDCCIFCSEPLERK